MTKPWYNEERVRQPGSVILKAFVAGREAERARTKQTAGKRAYAGAAYNRLNSDWSAMNTSGDSEILTSLRPLRARSRQLIRDNEYASNAVRIIQNNVVGTGIGMQAQVVNARGKLQDNINDAIETAWANWSDRKICHTAGLLGFADIERLVVGQLVEAGEVLIRKIKRPFGKSKIPLALEIIEADRLMDNQQGVLAPGGNSIRMGVEVDEWGRPVAYWLHPNHPGDFQFAVFQATQFVRVPADEIIHLYIVDRYPQTRGVPWFHATLKRLNNMGGYEEAEIVAARASANIVGFIKSPEAAAGDDVQNGQRLIDSEPGTFKSLLPGEDFVGFNPSRPNSQMEPFMRFMLRSVAAGIGVSYESLSRDYSQSNYSSSRLALLDDRDLWRVLQGFVARNFRAEIHRDWLEAAVLSGVLAFPDFYSNRSKYEAVRFKPRGWNWIDPTKEVTAYRLAVRAGFMTVSDVIGMTGGGADAEDIFKARRQELDMMSDLNLIFDTDPAQVTDKGQAQPLAPAQEGDGEAAETPEQEAAEPAADGDESSADKPKE
jgi:lambda family phage portal protein